MPKTQPTAALISFIVVSVIDCKQSSDSYNSKRSKYMPPERLRQTLSTISSIRNLVPDARIIFVEGGQDGNLLEEIKPLVDDYLFFGDRKLARMAVDSKHKTLGEVILMLFALLSLKTSNAELFIKITGRYRLNTNFDLNLWNHSSFNFKRSDRNVSSRLYGFPGKKRLQLFLALLWGSVRAIRGKRMEQILYKSYLTYPRAYLSSLGVEGEMGPSGKSIDE